MKITHEQIRNDSNALYYSQDEEVRKVAYENIYTYAIQQEREDTRLKKSEELKSLYKECFDYLYNNIHMGMKIDNDKYMKNIVRIKELENDDVISHTLMAQHKKMACYIAQQEKVSKLLELYRLKENLQEEYKTNENTLQRQKVLDYIRNISEEINQLEEEIEKEK